MLRSACRPERADVPFALPPKLLAVSLGVVMAACSADVTRLDAPMFGLTGGSGNRTAAAPVPQEGVWTNNSSRASTTGYGQGYRAPPRQQYAAAPRGRGHPARPYAPTNGSLSRDAYQPAPSQPAYRTPPYRTAYEAPTRQPDSRQNWAVAPQQQPAYRSQSQPKVAALPPQVRREPARSTPAPRPTMRDAAPASDTARRVMPAPTASRPAQERTTRATRSQEIEVQPGDTLYGLAERHDVSISELMTMNGLTSPVLRPGQRLMLPKGARMIAGSGPQSDRPAITQRTALAEPTAQTEPRFDTTERPSGNDTAPVQQDAAAYEAAGTYTIRRGESLYSIAVREGVSLAELQRINNIDDPRKVRAGTVLRLPSSSPSGTTASPAPASPRTLARAEPSQSEQDEADAVAAPEPENSSDPAQPVIINSRKRVVSLNKPETASDALPLAAESPSPDRGAGEKQADGIGKFRWPVRGRVIAGFGKQPDGSQSDGIKLAVPVGTDVHAAESGVVAFADDVLKDYGNLILLRHDDGWISAYAHNEELLVKRGDRVRRGQVIAKAGKTGNAETPQLHFELRKGSSPVDPIPHLEKL